MRRILFVDDEPRVLDGLQRLLRPQRQVWEMTFALGGEAALALLEEQSFDVIVSDMRMPKIDGATLLRHVREHYPHMARIVLSGYTEFDAVLRTVPVAHQYLTKPCDAQQLREVIERVCNVQAILSDGKLRQVAGYLGELPSSPRLYTALTQALASPDTSVAMIADIVEQDVAMSAKCLQLVNSAFFGLARRVTNIRQAVMYLGTNMLRTLVFSVEVFRSFDPSGRLGRRTLAGLESHALATAGIARSLVQDKQQSDDAFIGGLLHDVGKLVLASRLPQRFEQIVATAIEKRRPLHEIELEVLGVTHAELGAYLLGLWGLPYQIVEVVAYHHRPDQVPHRSFGVLDAVHVANALANEYGTRAVPAHTVYAELSTSYLESIGAAEELPNWHTTAARVLEGKERDDEQ